MYYKFSLAKRWEIAGVMAAVIGAASCPAFLVWKTQDMKEITREISRRGQGTNWGSDANFALAHQIKNLNNIKRYIRDLTYAEIKQMEELQWQNNVNAQVIAIWIEGNQDYAATLSGDRRAEMEAKIASMKREHEALSSLIPN